jgi:hypothetical protein
MSLLLGLQNLIHVLIQVLRSIYLRRIMSLILLAIPKPRTHSQPPRDPTWLFPLSVLLRGYL